MTLKQADADLVVQPDPRRGSPRRRLVVGAAAAALLAAGALTWAGPFRGSDERPVATAGTRDLRADEVVSRTALPGGAVPRYLEVHGERVRISSPTAITTLEAGSGEAVTQLDGEHGGPVVEIYGTLWASREVGDRSGYVRLDAETGRELAFADVGSANWLAAGRAGLWAVAAGNDIVRLEPFTGRVMFRVTLPERPYGLFVGENHVVAQAAVGGAVMIVDEGLMRLTGDDVTRSVDLSRSLPGVVVDDQFWVVEPATAELVRVDLSDGRELGRTRIPESDPSTTGATIYVLGTDGDEVGTWEREGSGPVWLTSMQADGRRTLVELDRGTAQVRDVLRLPSGAVPYLVDSSGDDVWLAATGTAEVLRLRPERT